MDHLPPLKVISPATWPTNDNDPREYASRGDGSVGPIEDRLEASHDLRRGRWSPDGTQGVVLQKDLPRYAPFERRDVSREADPDCDACAGERHRCPIAGSSRSSVGMENWRLCPNAM